MAQALKPSDFANAVNAILAEYKDVVDVKLEYATNKVAIEAAENVKRNISQTELKGKKYRNSIRSRSLSEGTNGRYSSLVFANPPYYRLTHLLEHGHATRNGGRTRAFPHWEEAEQTAVREFESTLRRELE